MHLLSFIFFAGGETTVGSGGRLSPVLGRAAKTVAMSANKKKTTP